LSFAKKTIGGVCFPGSLSEAFVSKDVVLANRPEDARHAVNIGREKRLNAVAALEGHHHCLGVVSPKRK
jgi:hypothetical protein